MVFASNICGTGQGSLQSRDDPRVYNSDKEKALLLPVNDHYSKLGKECVRLRICIDLFYAICTPSKSVDLASIAPLSSLTGGDLHLLPFTTPAVACERLHYTLFRVLTRSWASEVQIKARVSPGLSVAEYFGGFGNTTDADIALAAMDSDKALGFRVANDDKLREQGIKPPRT